MKFWSRRTWRKEVFLFRSVPDLDNLIILFLSCYGKCLVHGIYFACSIAKNLVSTGSFFMLLISSNSQRFLLLPRLQVKKFNQKAKQSVSNSLNQRQVMWEYQQSYLMWRIWTKESRIYHEEMAVRHCLDLYLEMLLPNSIRLWDIWALRPYFWSLLLL